MTAPIKCGARPRQFHYKMVCCYALGTPYLNIDRRRSTKFQSTKYYSSFLILEMSSFQIEIRNILQVQNFTRKFRGSPDSSSSMRSKDIPLDESVFMKHFLHLFSKAIKYVPDFDPNALGSRTQCSTAS